MGYTIDVRGPCPLLVVGVQAIELRGATREQARVGCAAMWRRQDHEIFGSETQFVEDVRELFILNADLRGWN